MAVTEYGKFIRDLRMKRNETIYDTADLFNVSVPFVSAVENGKKKVPQGWYDKIVEYYDLEIDAKEKLKQLIVKSDKKITFYFEEYSTSKVDLMVNLKSVLDRLDEKIIKELKEFFEKINFSEKEINICKSTKKIYKEVIMKIENNLDR